MKTLKVSNLIPFSLAASFLRGPKELLSFEFRIIADKLMDELPITVNGKAMYRIDLTYLPYGVINRRSPR